MSTLDKITVLELMQRLAALGVTETFMCCVAGTYQIELDLGDDDHSRVILGTSRVDMIEAMTDLLVKLDAVDTMRSALRTADAADPDGAQPITTRALMGIAADGGPSVPSLLEPALVRFDSVEPLDGASEVSTKKHWPDCSVNHGGGQCDMGDECGTDGAMPDVSSTRPEEDEAEIEEPPEPERCSICNEPAHPSETNDRGDHEACADVARRGDEA